MALKVVKPRSTAVLTRLFRRDRGDPGRLLHFDLVFDDVFVGTAPHTRTDVERLVSALGVTAVLNLQTDEDNRRWGIPWAELEAAYADRHVVVERQPIRDFDGDDLVCRVEQAVDVLDRLLAVGHRVYLHCTAGQQRSPAVAIGFLVRHRGLSLDEAVARITRRRQCAPDLEALAAVYGEASAK